MPSRALRGARFAFVTRSAAARSASFGLRHVKRIARVTPDLPAATMTVNFVARPGAVLSSTVPPGVTDKPAGTERFCASSIANSENEYVTPAARPWATQSAAAGLLSWQTTVLPAGAVGGVGPAARTTT